MLIVPYRVSSDYIWPTERVVLSRATSNARFLRRRRRHVEKLQQSSFSVGDDESNRMSAKKKQFEQPKNRQTDADLTNAETLFFCSSRCRRRFL